VKWKIAKNKSKTMHIMINTTTVFRKLFVLISFVLLLNHVNFGQQTDNWYFGSPTIPGMGLRIDFSSGSPVVTRGYPLVTEEGSSSISDASGVPLFYTDGQKIWDASTNATFGTGLLGGQSSTQSAIVMPKPGTTNQWLVFTSSQTSGASGTNGINYYTVTGTGSPGVSPFSISGATNLAGANTVGEGLFIIGSTKAGSSFWVIARESGTVNGTSGKVRAWDVSNTGAVNTTPVISTLSNTGWTQTNYASNIGTIKSNTCQNQLAFSYLSGDVDLTDFNTATGQVVANTAKRITGPSAASGNNGSYGLEFSPNDQYLYITDLGGKKLFRFTVSNPSGVAPQLGLSTTYEAGQLQLGPDGNIYMAITGDGHLGNGYLGVISNPNSAGATFTENGLLITTNSNPNGFSYRGLPTFPKTLVVTNPNISPSDTTICQNATVNFKYVYAGSASTIAWDFGDPGSGAANTSASATPSHTYNTLGVFKAKVIITDVCSRQWKDSINVTVVPPIIASGSVTCGANGLTLDNPATDPNEPKYVWYKNSVSPANIIGVGTPLTYTVGGNSAMPTQICVTVAASVTSSSATNKSIAASLSMGGAANGSPYVSNNIDVLASSILLKSFDVKFWVCPTGPASQTVTIKNGSGTTVYNEVLPITGCASGAIKTININTTLPQGTGYTITLTSTGQYYRGSWSAATNAGEITYGPEAFAGVTSIANIQYDAFNFSAVPTCSTPSCYAVSCVLPIDLISFTGKLTDHTTVLNWSTAVELNNDYFEIQRSTDGINFTTIGTKKGNGNSNSINEYEFIDAAPVNGINYYRLVQHDFNGKTSYSNVIKVDIENTSNFSVSPNPSVSSFNVKFLNLSGGEFTVMDVLGRVLLNRTIEAGTESIVIGSEFTKGVYVLRLSGSNGVATQRVVKE
jgi:hypothetical protein